MINGLEEGKSIGETQTSFFGSLTHSDVFSVLFMLEHFFNFVTKLSGNSLIQML